MKNVTIALDNETHHRARIHAAEMGTSLSALVKTFLEQLGSAAPAGVREMKASFTPQPPEEVPKQPRKPGAMRTLWVADDFDDWPDDVQASFNTWSHGDDKPA